MKRIITWSTAAGLCGAVTAGGIMLCTAFGAGGTSASDGRESTADLASRLQSSAPASQQDALDDNSISAAEYAAAADATIACSQGKGAPVELLPANGAAPPSFTFRAADVAEGEKFRAILEECKAVHFTGVQELWNAEHRPSAEQARAAVQWVADCVADAGFAVDAESPSAEEMAQWTMSTDLGLAVAAGRCIDQHYRTFGYWP